MIRFLSFLLCVAGFAFISVTSLAQDMSISDSMLIVLVRHNDSSELQKYFGDLRIKPVPPDTSVINKSLLIAVYYQKPEMVRFALSRGANVLTIWYENRANVIHWAALKNDLTIISRLIDAGVDVNVQTVKGKTPMMFAVMDSNLVKVKLLYALGSDLSLKDTSGKTAVEMAGEGRMTDLRKRIDDFLKVPYIDPDLLFQYCSPKCILKCVKERSKDIRYRSGKSALHYAVLYDVSEVCRTLPGKEQLLNGKDSSGRTPLHYAAFLKNDPLYKLLLGTGAGSGVPDTYGETPAQVYKRYSNPDIKEVNIGSPEVRDDYSTRPELVIPQEFGRAVSLHLSPDGKYAVSAHDSKKVMIWDVASGKLIRSIIADSIDVLNACFTSDGKKIITSSDQRISIWDILTRKELYRFEKFNDDITSLTTTPDGKYILNGKYNGEIDIWDINTYNHIGTFSGHSDVVRSISVTEDGNCLLSGSQDETVKLWDINTRSEIRTFSSQPDKLISVSYCEKTNSVAAGSRDGKIILWNLLNGKEIDELIGHQGRVKALCFSADGRFLLSAGEDSTINLWDLSAKQIQQSYYGHQDEITSLFFLNDEKFILSSSHDLTIRVWDIGSGQQIGEFGSKPLPYIRAAIFYYNNQEIVADTYYGKVFVWDNKENRIKYHGSGSLCDDIYNSLSPDGKYLLNVTDKDSLVLADYKSGKRIRCFDTDSVRNACLTHNGLFALSYHWNGKLNLWDINTGLLIRTFSVIDNDIKTLCISSDDQFVFTSGWWGKITKWDIATGQLVKIFEINKDWHWIEALAISSDSKYLLAGTFQGHVLLISASTGEIIKTFSGGTDLVSSVDFSTDDQLALTASNYSPLTIWETQSGKERATLVFVDSTNWVVTTPSGLFDASDGAMKEMYFVAGMEIIEFSQLKHRYWQPGLLPILLGYSNEPLRQVPTTIP